MTSSVHARRKYVRQSCTEDVISSYCVRCTEDVMSRYSLLYSNAFLASTHEILQKRSAGHFDTWLAY